MFKALFFPNYLGGGFGHTSRCLALAEALTRRGGKVAFALNGPHLQRVIQAGYETYVLETPRMPKSSASAFAYIYIPNMSYQLLRDGFDHPRVVEKALTTALEVVQKVRPDVLIGDGWPLTRLVAHRAGLPVVQLVKSIVHPQPERLVWGEEPLAGMIVPDPGPVFNPVLDKIGLPTLTRAEELLDGDLLLLPSIPSLDPMTVLPPKTFYVGPIIRQSSLAQPLPPFFSALNGTRPVVYFTIGGAAGHGGSETLFKLMIEALAGNDYQVIASTGGKVDPKSLGGLPSNIRLERWIPNAEMIARSDVVIFHGGYTRMEILQQGLPSVIIPFHSEQEYYGRLVAGAGAAIVVPYSEEPYYCIQARWRGGSWWKSKRFTLHVRLKPTLSPDCLRSAVAKTLTDPTIRLKAQALQSFIESYGGCEQALDLIESHRLPGIPSN